MIEINLLPEEKRRSERTPLPRLMTILAGVVTWGVLIVVLITFFAIKIPGLEKKKKTIAAAKASLEQQAAKYDECLRKLAQMSVRQDVYKDLARKRVRWAVLLDQLAPAEPNGLWLKAFKVVPQQAVGGLPGRGGAKPGAKVTMEGYAASPEGSASAEDLLTEFVSKLKENPEFIKRFKDESIIPTASAWVELRSTQGLPGDKEKLQNIPKSARYFKFEMEFVGETAPPAAAPAPVSRPQPKK